MLALGCGRSRIWGPRFASNPLCLLAKPRCTTTPKPTPRSNASLRSRSRTPASPPPSSRNATATSQPSKQPLKLALTTTWIAWTWVAIAAPSRAARRAHNPSRRVGHSNLPWPLRKMRMGLVLRGCRTPQAKRFGLNTCTETVERALPDGRPPPKGVDLQRNEKGQLPLSS